MSDTPVAPLPTSYDWGFVVGRSISAMADTAVDPDRFPEARGSNGRVTFTPHTRYKKELSAPTAFVQFEVVTARIENGHIVDAQGQYGIYLISGAYKVDFKIDSGSIPGFDILVTPDHTPENPLNLVTASPFVPEVGTPVTTAVIPAGAAENQIIAWRNGRLVWVDGLVRAEAAAARAEAAAEEFLKTDLSALATKEEVNTLQDTIPQVIIDNASIVEGEFITSSKIETTTRPSGETVLLLVQTTNTGREITAEVPSLVDSTYDSGFVDVTSWEVRSGVLAASAWMRRVGREVTCVLYDIDVAPNRALIIPRDGYKIASYVDSWGEVRARAMSVQAEGLYQPAVNPVAGGFFWPGTIEENTRSSIVTLSWWTEDGVPK